MTQQSPPPGEPDEPTARQPAVPGPPPPYPATPAQPSYSPTAEQPPYSPTAEQTATQPPTDQAAPAPAPAATAATAAAPATAVPPRRPWRNRRVPILIAAATLLLGCFLGASAIALGAVIVNVGDDRHDGPRISRDAREGRVGDREEWREHRDGRPALPPHRREPGGPPPGPASPAPAAPVPSASS